jgi:hypothetical protein
MDSAVLPFVVVAGTAALALSMAARQRRARAERESRLATEAGQRGWRHSVHGEGRTRAQRWEATTDGLSWTAEEYVHRRGKAPARHIVRWSHARLPGATPTVLLMGTQADVPALPDAAGGDGLVASLARTALDFALDRALAAHFGPWSQVRAGTLQRAAGVEAQVPGFAVLATRADQAARLIEDGFGAAVREAFAAGRWPHESARRPWILIDRERLALAAVGRIERAADLEPYVTAGLRLARALGARW